MCEVKLERDDDDDQMVSVVFDSHDITLYVGTSGEARACFRIHHEMLSFTVQDPYPVPEEESPSVQKKDEPKHSRAEHKDGVLS